MAGVGAAGASPATAVIFVLCIRRRPLASHPLADRTIASREALAAGCMPSTAAATPRCSGPGVDVNGSLQRSSVSGTGNMDYASARATGRRYRGRRARGNITRTGDTCPEPCVPPIRFRDLPHLHCQNTLGVHRRASRSLVVVEPRCLRWTQAPDNDAQAWLCQECGSMFAESATAVSSSPWARSTVQTRRSCSRGPGFLLRPPGRQLTPFTLRQAIVQRNPAIMGVAL